MYFSLMEEIENKTKQETADLKKKTKKPPKTPWSLKKKKKQ